MRARIEHRRPSGLSGHCHAKAQKDERRCGEDVQGDQFHFPCADLLAQVLRRSPDHEARNEDSDDGCDEHAVQARTSASGRDFSKDHVEDGQATPCSRE